ncbi:ATP-grasp domain-containing protein [Streptomyces sp. XD-27]|uniref:ATP-grasp domain-containing protein n=1 Tax=Streptomyces sp. XD-27 TaxID=3062779 RepID=UPI0026F441B6|nr:ATP-grasp domain-containing protein [Streptomyces sp. XD-27]WKX73499.1 ATP-grasp domain-containing protein [Streptomyces sp. XD-27]
MVRRISEQARRRTRVIGADRPALLDGAPEEHLALFDEVVPLDVQDATACREWALATRPDVGAVLTIRETSVLAAAEVTQALGLPGNAPEVVARVRTKDLCRQRLGEAGFPQPHSAVCRGLADAERFLEATGPGPWIVKPRAGLGSIGVSRIDHRGELAAAVDGLWGGLSPKASLPPASSFLIETYVTGEEYSAEGVVVGGVPHVLALTHKQITDGFLSTSQRVPSGLAPDVAADAEDTVARALKALGVTHGIFHVELWLTPSGVVLGEFHVRTAGDYIHALVEHTRPGLELFGACVDDALGRAPTPFPDPVGSARVEFLFAPAGTLRAVHGWDELAGHPAVRIADLNVAPGDVVPAVKDAFTRSAVFVVGADSPGDADALATGLASRVVFDARPAEPGGPMARDREGTWIRR